MNQARRISLNAGALVLSSGAKSVASLVFVVVAARILGVGSFGAYELTLHYFELFLSLIGSGLAILLTRELARSRHHLGRSLSAAATLLSALTLLGAVALWLLPMAFDYEPETTAAIRLAVIALVPAAFCRLLEAVFIAFEVAHVVTMGTVVEGFLRVTSGITLLVLGYGVEALVLVLFGSHVCLLLVYLMALGRHLPESSWDLRWPVLRQMARDWRAFAAENWLSNLANSAGVIILSAVHGEVAVGLYFAAVKILRFGRVVANSYTNAVFPHMSRLSAASSDALHRLAVRSIQAMCLLIAPVIVTISAYSDVLIRLLYSTDFAESSSILRVVVWILLLQFVNPFLSHVLFARGEQMKSLQVAAIRLFVVVSASLLLIPPYSGVGAAWAVLTAAAAASVVYARLALSGRGYGTLAPAVGRIVTPAAGLATVFWLMREPQPILAPVVGAGVYLGLAAMTGAITMKELRAVRSLWRQRTDAT